MILLIEIIILCGVFWLMCFLGSGTDEKNIKSFKSYPEELQRLLINNPKYHDKIKNSSMLMSLISNFIIFSIIFFLLGLFIKKQSFLENFIAVLILSESLNLFDLLIIDLCWWRNSKRIRFSLYPDKNLYRNPQKHINAFLRATILFIIVSAFVGLILTWI